jgi:CIC family chloride channel protein
MTTKVETLPASATVGQVRTRFAAGGHGAYPILDGDRLAGIVTRGDLFRDGCADAEPLVDHASAQVLTVAPADEAQRALQIMADEALEHLPVVDGHRLVGICTRSDLLKVRRRQYELERRQDGLVALLRRSDA